jgi:capsular polysaccharide transport system permease protein
MTTKLKATRFRIRRPVFPAVEKPTPPGLFEQHDDGFGPGLFPTASAAKLGSGDVSSANEVATEADLETIRKEGLTGRQLRMARRAAQKHGLPATSDFDAVLLLRKAGIDPFKRSSMLELVASEMAEQSAEGSRALANVPQGDGVKLPQTIKPIQIPNPEMRAEESHIHEVRRIQQDLAKRRRRKSILLVARLAFFVLLPTVLTGWYYFAIATPLYSTKSEFVIQQAQSPSSLGGAGSIFSGSPLATSQDSIAVQGYLQSREAMLRLDTDHAFKTHFADPNIDPIQRLTPDPSLEEAYKTYKRNVQIAYDPTEGIVKMEVIATSPEKSVEFATALIGYAEGQVDQLTQRLREDQMKGARDAFVEAEQKMLVSQRNVVELQERYKVLSSEVEVTLITSQIGQMESLLSADRLSLQQMLSNSQPNAARVEPLERRITALEGEISALRSRLTENGDTGESLAQVQSGLLVAQADVQTRQLILAQSIQSMEGARTEANRQTRYLSLSVSPIQPDEAAYPRAFESTLVAMLIFCGVYLMISMTAAILREQVTA